MAYDGVLLYEKHYSISLIKRDTFMLGAIKSRGRFEVVKGEDLIRLNGTVQIIRLQGTIFVIDVKVLERNMGFTALIHKAAAETLVEISELDILENMKGLQESVAEIAFARKLAKVHKASPLVTLKIPRQAIIDFTKTNQALPGKFRYNNDGTKNHS